MMAMAACMTALTLVPIPTASQALYPRDHPKEPGAKSWALERMKLPPFNPPRTRENTPDLRGRVMRLTAQINFWIAGAPSSPKRGVR